MLYFCFNSSDAKTICFKISWRRLGKKRKRLSAEGQCQDVLIGRKLIKGKLLRLIPFFCLDNLVVSYSFLYKRLLLIAAPRKIGFFMTDRGPAICSCYFSDWIVYMITQSVIRNKWVPFVPAFTLAQISIYRIQIRVMWWVNTDICNLYYWLSNMEHLVGYGLGHYP